jgi:hypothetical protein
MANRIILRIFCSQQEGVICLKGGKTAEAQDLIAPPSLARGTITGSLARNQSKTVQVSACKNGQFGGTAQNLLKKPNRNTGELVLLTVTEIRPFESRRIRL